MKKIKYLLLIIAITFMSITGVNADEVVFDASDTTTIVNALPNSIARAYEIIETNPFKYYSIELISDTYLKLYLFDDVSYTTNIDISSIDEGLGTINIRHFRNYEYSIWEDGTENFADYSDNSSNSLLMFIADNFNKQYRLYDTNFDYKINTDLSISGIYTDNIVLNNGDSFPTIKKLLNHNSWDDYYINAIYTTVNLDDYEYVLLNLKDYTKKEAFNTTMKVKGSIGITPIYEYGTVEKSTITDICNISYSDYTDYRFSILKNDLINSAIYLVKACEDGSSFKFNSNIFNITYVTADNVNDPVVTIGGVDYHTIPFNQLSNTVNKNTEEGFIPGESEGFNPVESLVDYVTSFWSSLSSFMSLVTKFFNTLPIEIRAVAITCFTTACTLGLLKILKS